MMKSDMLRCRNLHFWYKIQDVQWGISRKQKEPPQNQNPQNPLGICDSQQFTCIMNYDLQRNQYCKTVWGRGKSHSVTY